MLELSSSNDELKMCENSQHCIQAHCVQECHNNTVGSKHSMSTAYQAHSHASFIAVNHCKISALNSFCLDPVNHDEVKEFT